MISTLHVRLACSDRMFTAYVCETLPNTIFLILWFIRIEHLRIKEHLSFGMTSNSAVKRCTGISHTLMHVRKAGSSEWDLWVKMWTHRRLWGTLPIPLQRTRPCAFPSAWQETAVSSQPWQQMCCYLCDSCQSDRWKTASQGCFTCNSLITSQVDTFPHVDRLFVYPLCGLPFTSFPSFLSDLPDFNSSLSGALILYIWCMLETFSHAKSSNFLWDYHGVFFLIISKLPCVSKFTKHFLHLDLESQLGNLPLHSCHRKLHLSFLLVCLWLHTGI